MSTAGDGVDPLDLAEVAYGILGVNIRQVFERSPATRDRTAALVRRILASGYDADDCISGNTPIAYRCEIRALTRALAALRENGL